MRVLSGRVPGGELIVESRAESSTAFKVELYSYISRLIRARSVLISARSIIHLRLRMRFSKSPVNIRMARSTSRSGIRKILAERAELTFIMAYWRIKFKTTEMKALYQTLVVLFTIYLSFREGIFAISTAVSDTNQKSKIEAKVKARTERSFFLERSSSIVGGMR